jgi:hypothetical protein
VLLAVFVFDKASIWPLVIEDEDSVRAVPVVRLFHVQICAQATLSNVSATVELVSAERAALPLLASVPHAEPLHP